MDDKKIKALLESAGREYNQGKYSEAIAHWQEILSIDPGNQKAKEGIRMAQLLVVNWEAAESDSDEGAALLPADGADTETQEKIEVGIARVRELLAGGRYQEALEGCQLLAELAPAMESVRQLQEEVTQAHEAQPFIKERLDRAKRFLAQGKSKEAAEEARNILSVDRTNQQAQVILDRATGGVSSEGKPKAPSAFQVDRAGKAPPPSPFSGRAAARDTDALLAQFEFEPDKPGAAPKRPAPPPKPPAPAKPAAAPEDALSLEMEPPSPPAARGASKGGPEVEAKIKILIDEGGKLFAQKKYQAAIEVWSRVFALDEAHADAGVLIDRAKALLEDVSRQADEAYFRGVDALESGNLPEAKRALQEVLSIHPDHADAKSYMKQVDERLAASPPAGRAAPAATVPPQAASKPASASHPTPSRAEQEAAALDSSSVPLAVSAEEHPRAVHKAPPAAPSAPPASAGVAKKKPVVPVAAKRSVPLMVGGGLAAVAALAGGVWYFLLRGGQEEPQGGFSAAPPAGTSPAAEEGSSVPAAVEGPPAAPSPSTPAPAASGSLEVLPGMKPSGQAGSAADEAAAAKRKIEVLMKEGRGLFKEERYADALARFDQVLALDPANFDAVEMKTRAAAEAQKAARFNKELDSAKAAFADGDWAGSLYKLYRLREARMDMTILTRYIKNANYNWGIESLSNFETDNAIEHFKDALEMAPGDPAIQKNIEVASRYRRHARDAAFDAFVKTLKPKGIEDR